MEIEYNLVVLLFRCWTNLYFHFLSSLLLLHWCTGSWSARSGDVVFLLPAECSRVSYDLHSRRLCCSQWNREIFSFWNSLAFSMIQRRFAIWSLVPRPFLNLACTSGSWRSMYGCSLFCMIFSIILLAWGMSAMVRWFEQSSVLVFFGMGMNIDLFHSWGQLLVFHICWQSFVMVFTASFSRACINSMEIPSTPGALPLFRAPIARSTSLCRISGSSSCSWSSYSVVVFVLVLSSDWYSCSVYSFHLFFMCCPSNSCFPWWFRDGCVLRCKVSF